MDPTSTSECDCDGSSRRTWRCHCVIEHTYCPCLLEDGEEPFPELESLNHKIPAVWTTYRCHFATAAQGPARSPCPSALWQALRPSAEVAKHYPALDDEASGFYYTPECCRAGFARESANIEARLIFATTTSATNADTRVKLHAESNIKQLQHEREEMVSYHANCDQNREEYLRQPGIVQWVSVEEVRI